MKSGETFPEWLDRFSRSDTSVGRQRLAASFEQYCVRNGTPVIEDGKRAVFVYFGEARSISLFGDMTDWTESRDLVRLPDTNLWYLIREFDPYARLQYWFFKDGDSEKPMLDPLNPRRGYCGLGPLSEVHMPGYREPELWKAALEQEDVFSGMQPDLTIESKYLGYGHRVDVWIPPGCSGKNPLPVIYFQDGLDYILYAHAPFLLQRLISDKRIPPCMGVFVTPPNLHRPAEPNRSTEYGLNGDYVLFFCRELIPWVDSRFPTCEGPENRTVIGDSYGGLISMYIAFHHPDLFGRVCCQSGYFSFQNSRLIESLETSEHRDIRMYFHVGGYERRVGASFIPPGDQDFLAANRRMERVLSSKGYTLRYRESEEGHNWGNWGKHLIEALEFLFSEDRA